MHSHSMRGTKVTMTKGQSLHSKLPECSAPKTQMIALRLMHALLIYPPYPMHKHNACDITKWCHNHLLPILTGKALCMHRQAALACLHIHWHPCQPISVFPTAMHGPYHQFCIPNFEPVTPSSRYFGVPSYQSLKFIKNMLKWLCTHKCQE